ncbi:MAG: TIGR04376 family protein [Cyanophyceae cyanobacterium]
MSLFDDLSQFLETRLEEFLRSHPHLELQALEEQLREQEQDTAKLITALQRQEQQLETEILAVAQDIQRWHARIAKAKAANRLDLVEAAQEREAALLRQGNQLWGQRAGVEKRLVQSQELLTQIQQRRKEVQAEAERARAQSPPSSWDTAGWNRSPSSAYSRAADPLEAEFQRWELDEELEQMKRNL